VNNVWANVGKGFPGLSRIPSTELFSYPIIAAALRGGTLHYSHLSIFGFTSFDSVRQTAFSRARVARGAAARHGGTGDS
jgi:hypothetical protein